MPSLAEKYGRWDTFADSDDEAGGGRTASRHAGAADLASAHYRGVQGFGLAAVPTPSDLDAVSGPVEEVAAIRHNFRTNDADADLADNAGVTPSRAPSGAAPAPATTTAGQGRSSSGRKENAKPAAHAEGNPPHDHFARWDRYDAEGAILDLDNEGKVAPEDAPAMVEADATSMRIDCVDYKKDRAEHDVDVEFEEKTKDLKQRIAYYFQAASQCKDEGNRWLAGGDVRRAMRAYKEGIRTLKPCLDIDVLCAPSVAAKVNTLGCHLNSNCAQACLKVDEDEDALAYATAAVALDGTHDKSRYRRATALWRLTRTKAALEELDNLGPAHKEGAKLRERILVASAV